MEEVPHAGINRISDLNDDILHLIFERFDLQPASDSTTTTQTRKDLLSAAKTCKAFVEPALNSLWRVLPSLSPLLLLLPSAKIINNHYVSLTLSLYLSYHLTSSYFIKFVDRLPLNNWERFDIHAPRVRSLYMEPFRMVISPHVYLRIRSLRPRDTPLLPGLKEIYIPDHLNTSLDFSSAALLLASDSSFNLIHLDESATSDPHFCIPFLCQLSANSPSLTHLALCGTANMSLDLDLVLRFRNLQCLHLKLSGTYLGSQFLQDLGKLDNLLDLTLDTTSPIEGFEGPTTRPTNSTFIKLKKLHILGTPNSISRVLEDMHVLTNLTTLLIHEKKVEFGRNTECTESSWKRCFAIISTFSAIENIQVTQFERSPRTSHYRLSTSCFFPLYKLNNVTSFVIENGSLSGSDEDFRFLACAFPKMKKFVEPCAEYREGRTLACLPHFSQANRHLRELKISLATLDISENLKAINVIGRPIIQDHQHPLEELHIASNFGSLTLSDMIQVAQFLDLIFPNLSTLKAYDGSEDSTWTKIQQIRKALQDARIKASSATKISNEQGEHGILP